MNVDPINVVCWAIIVVAATVLVVTIAQAVADYD